MTPTRTPASFLAKLIMNGVSKAFLCEGFADRKLIGLIAAHFNPPKNIQVFIPKEIDPQYSGKSAVRSLAVHCKAAGFTCVLPGNPKVLEVAIFMDSDLDGATGTRHTHPRIVYSRGYSIESDVFLASNLEAAANKCVGISTAFQHSLLANAGNWIQSCERHWADWSLVCCLSHWCAVPSLKGFGTTPAYSSGWMPTLKGADLSRANARIDATLRARGLDPSSQRNLISSVMASSANSSWFFNGKWLELFFVEYVMHHATAAGRAIPSQHYLDAVCLQCVMDFVDLRHAAFSDLTNAVAAL